MTGLMDGLFVTLPRLLRSGGPIRDLRGLLYQVTRLELEDSLGLAFGYSHYDNIAPRRIGNDPIAVQPGRVFQKSLS